MDIVEKLESAGLSRTEAAVYLAALTKGPLLPKLLAEEAGIKRPTLYELLPKLLKKGLLEESIKGKRTYFVAQDFQPFLDRRRADLEEIEKVLPEMRALLGAASVKPRIVFFEGVAGVKRVYQDHLRERKEILELVGIEHIHPDLQKYIVEHYIPERTRRAIPLKMLVCGPAEAGPFRVRSTEREAREVRVFSKNALSVPLGLNIYGDNVSITLHRADSEAVGIIIRSPEIAAAFRSVFSFLWLAAPREEVA